MAGLVAASRILAIDTQRRGRPEQPRPLQFEITEQTRAVVAESER